jgi:hypothetical protein
VPTYEFPVEVLPCPFCGLAEVNIGVMAAQCYGVECTQCRFEVSRYIPDKWPRGVWKRTLSAVTNRKRLVRWVIEQAVAVWNRRSAADTPSTVTAHVNIP